MKYLIIKMIKFYQKFVSPLKPNSCRFYPTCSEYTVQALQKYGLVLGLKKAIFRILRCHPFNSGGYDPV